MTRAATWVAVVGCAIALPACGSGSDDDAGSASASTASRAAASDVAPPTPPRGVARFETVEPGSGRGLTVGFTQLALSSGFPQDVQRGMEAAAETAGVELITCDSNLDAARALDCARNFRTRGVDGLVTFQADANAAPRICAAGPDVPVISIDIEQKPCETAFMGAANEYAGELAGYELGQYFQREHDCEYDAFVSLEALQVGAVNEARMGGMRRGFESVCGEIHDLRRIDTGGAGGDVAQRQMQDTLTALPGRERVIVVGINEDGILGALAAARSQNREDDLYLAVQNFNPRNCTIYEAPHWVGSVAYFPERYGDIVIPNIVRAARGERLPSELLIPHEFVTTENVEQLYPDYSCST